MINNRCYLGSVVKYGKIGEGAFSDVYQCDYLDAFFAYKEFKDFKYVEFIKDRIEKLTQYSEERFVFPYKLIYKKPTDELFLGYVMDCKHNYKNLSNFYYLDINKKIEILKKARILVDKLHKKYNFIHTDINLWNILYNEEQDDLCLIDFDSYIDLNDNLNYLNNNYNTIAQYYSNNVGVDKDLDIFLFNLTTFALIKGISIYQVFNYIYKKDFGFIENEKCIDILESYNNIECNKSLKKEYVIDYL